MEEDEITEHLNDLKLVYQSINNGGALLLFKLNKNLHLEFILQKNHNHWVIDRYLPLYY